MCILIVKPKGKICPSKEILEECFYRNPDGAGFSYNKNGVIVLRKGFMTFEDFYEASKKIPAESTALIHCRIGTSGGNTAGLTHPYPLCNDYKRMQKTTQILKPSADKKAYAVAHNGIFDKLEIRKDVNDTCVFIANILNPLNELSKDILNSQLDSVINRCVDGSRIAILDNEGNCSRYGSGWIEDCGIYYSNSSYKPYSFSYGGKYDWRDYDWRDYDYEDIIYDKDCYYKYNKNTDNYDKKEYTCKEINDAIKKYGSWDNYLSVIRQQEENDLEDLKMEYPMYAEDIDYYATQGMTAFQIRQWAEAVFDDEYITHKYDKYEDYFEDDTGKYKMSVKDDTGEIVMKKIEDKKKKDELFDN